VPSSAVVVYAHPYPDRSRAGRALFEAVADLPGVDTRVLYSMYPDFAIDVEAEQAALERADLVVWQSPFYWYGVPALLHHWVEKVLTDGWAYGPGGTALAGKACLWVATTGAPQSAYRPGALHGYAFDAFVPPIAQTARFCGMRWQEPLIVHGAVRIEDAALDGVAQTYRRRVSSHLAGEEASLG
jgi:glutathione-regulated potassium-efflux system ancillary protein KefF